MKRTLVAILLALVIFEADAARAAPKKMQFLSGEGVPMAHGCVLASRITYRDPEMTKTNPNPIFLDGHGMATIFFKEQDYQFMVWSRGNCMKGKPQVSKFTVQPTGACHVCQTGDR
jgi:hypothetical protein